MEKKKYLYPLTQVEVLNTKELMTISSESEFPGDAGGSGGTGGASSAPARDKVF